jgi:hypothetical protein
MTAATRPPPPASCGGTIDRVPISRSVLTAMLRDAHAAGYAEGRAAGYAVGWAAGGADTSWRARLAAPIAPAESDQAIAAADQPCHEGAALRLARPLT